MPAVADRTRPYAYAAWEAAGQAVVGHLDPRCRDLKGMPLPPADWDPWPCSRCVSLEQLADWARRVPDAAARGWATTTGTAACEILPAEEKKLPPELKVWTPGAENCSVTHYTGNLEDTTMSTTTAPRFTAEKFATLKSLFADVIRCEVPGMVGFRSALLDAYKAGDLTPEGVDQAISLLLDIVNPCNDDGPVPTYPALDGLLPADPAPAPVAAGPEFKAGMIVTNAAGQIVRLYLSKSSGKLYGKVRVDGYWEYLAGAMKGARHLTADEAAAYGHQHHACVFCATPLEDERDGCSVQVGYGPVCAGKYGLPWGPPKKG